MLFERSDSGIHHILGILVNQNFRLSQKSLFLALCCESPRPCSVSVTSPVVHVLSVTCVLILKGEVLWMVSIWGLNRTTEWVQTVKCTGKPYQSTYNWHFYINTEQKVSKFEKAGSMVPLSKEKMWAMRIVQGDGQSCDNDFGTGPFFLNLWHLSWSNIQDLDWRLMLWNTMNVISRKQGRTDVAGLYNPAWHSLSLWKE